MKPNSAFFVLVCVVLTVLLGACLSPDEQDTSATVPAATSAALDFLYDVETTEETERIAGESFYVPEDNCGSPVAASATVSRQRSFRRTFNVDLSDSVVAEVGGGVPQVTEAKLGAEFERATGVAIESTDTVKISRDIPIPANSKFVATMQWLEYWSTGSIALQHLDGRFFESVPFKFLNTLYLSQLGIKYFDCATVIPVPERDVEIGLDAALSAQQKAMDGMATGNTELTEEEFSSLINASLSQNSQLTSIVDNVKFWFTPEAIYAAQPCKMDLNSSWSAKWH